MKKRLWKDLLNLNDSPETLGSKSVFSLVRKYYNEALIKKSEDIKRGDTTWYLDQTIFAVALHKFQEKERKARINLIPFQGKRLYQITNYDFKTKDFTDYHAFHEDLKSRSPKFDFVIQQLFEQKIYKLINDYSNEFF